MVFGIRLLIQLSQLVIEGALAGLGLAPNAFDHGPSVKIHLRIILGKLGCVIIAYRPHLYKQPLTQGTDIN